MSMHGIGATPRDGAADMHTVAKKSSIDSKNGLPDAAIDKTSQPLAGLTPLTTRWEARVPLRSHAWTSLHFVKDYILATIQYLFQRFCSPEKLRAQEQLSVTHLDRYMEAFNKSDNGAVFLSPNFSMLEENGNNWNMPAGTSKESYFVRLMKNFQSNNPNLDLPQNFWESPGALREALAKSNKTILALPINLSTGVGRHWTVVHFNFKDNTISYLDSKHPNKQADKVNARLEQALQWINAMDGEQKWEIKRPVNGNSQPSILTGSHQKDFWNCGIFALHFTALAGRGKTYAEIEQTPFNEMYREIAGRRLEVMNCVNQSMQQ